jgi:DsbC/DsbD-like thiol-disulfide interchange protein
MMKNKFFLVTSALLLAGLANAQEVPPQISVKVSAAASGKPLAVTVSIQFEEGLHGYQNPPSDPFENPIKISVTDKRFKLLKVTYPKGVSMTQEGSTKSSLVYMGKVDFPVQIELPKKPGKYTIPLNIAYQQCSDRTCYPPSSASVKVQVTIK